MNDGRLRELQEQFQSHLLNGDPCIVQRIVGTPRVNAPARLAIYSDAYRLRLLEALRVDFPALHTLAGDAEFERIGRAYLNAHPSGHFSIRYFGQHLAAFLQRDDRWREQPVFAEMAAFEWALGLSFDASDSPLIGVADVAAIPPGAWAHMHLDLHPSLQRLDLLWNVPGLWKAIEEEQPPQAPIAADHPLAWVIWRRDLKTFFRSAPVDEACGLDLLRQGESFATLCEGLCEWIDEMQAAAQAALYLRRWVQDGLVSRIGLD
ncbi:MAG: DNA-binding domain-containing protein [Gammaproteobacteria bacterium]